MGFGLLCVCVWGGPQITEKNSKIQVKTPLGMLGASLSKDVHNIIGEDFVCSELNLQGHLLCLLYTKHGGENLALTFQKDLPLSYKALHRFRQVKLVVLSWECQLLNEPYFRTTPVYELCTYEYLS